LKHEESVPYLEMCEDERNKLPAGVKHAPREVLQERDHYYESNKIINENKRLPYFLKYKIKS
jgi:hypothetical protein